MKAAQVLCVADLGRRGFDEVTRRDGLHGRTRRSAPAPSHSSFLPTTTNCQPSPTPEKGPASNKYLFTSSTHDAQSTDRRRPARLFLSLPSDGLARSLRRVRRNQDSNCYEGRQTARRRFPLLRTGSSATSLCSQRLLHRSSRVRGIRVDLASSSSSKGLSSD